MTALNRHVALGTGEEDEYPDDALNDNGPGEPVDSADGVEE